jgi:hypothetical protein
MGEWKAVTLITSARSCDPCELLGRSNAPVAAVCRSYKIHPCAVINLTGVKKMDGISYISRWLIYTLIYTENLWIPHFTLFKWVPLYTYLSGVNNAVYY